MDSKKRILIVDDEPNVRLVLGTTLSSVGYEVDAADDGVKALDRLQSSGPGFDLVLLDLQMPRMDGMELLSRLRDAGSIVPVVILTAHGSIPEAVAAMKLGAIDFLTKPITPEALRRVVADVILRHAPAAFESPPRAAHPVATDHVKQVAFDLARAKRALNRGQFSEAELVLKEMLERDANQAEAATLLARLQKLKEQEAQGSYRILRDWFSSGTQKKLRRSP
jgi:DNA-binding response OmpR family regulator